MNSASTTITKGTTDVSTLSTTTNYNDHDNVELNYYHISESLKLRSVCPVRHFTPCTM